MALIPCTSYYYFHIEDKDYHTFNNDNDDHHHYDNNKDNDSDDDDNDNVNSVPVKRTTISTICNRPLILVLIVTIMIKMITMNKEKGSG